MRTRTNTNRRGGLILAAVAAVALMGGSAFTGSLTLPAADSQAVGHGETTVTGGTVTTIDYSLNTDGSEVTSLAITFDDTYTTAEVTASLDGTQGSCDTITSANSTTCTFTGVTTSTLSTTTIAVDGTVDTSGA